MSPDAGAVEKVELPARDCPRTEGPERGRQRPDSLTPTPEVPGTWKVGSILEVRWPSSCFQGPELGQLRPGV